jgi:hypothetical protein
VGTLFARITAAMIIAMIVVTGAAVAAEIPIKGGCVIGHGRTPGGPGADDAIKTMQSYAALYRNSYRTYKGEERRARRAMSDLLELKHWTQSEVIQFGIHQRELLYIGVAADLAIGRVSASELPAYAASIERKIIEIETELRCELLPA